MNSVMSVKEGYMSDEKRTILDKTMNRREFLRMSGLSAIGVSTLSWLLPGCTSNKEDVAVFETASGVLIHESPRCTGCLLCESSCTSVNDGKVGQHLARVKISPNYGYGRNGVSGPNWENGTGEMGNFKLNAELCRQCEQPACALACPENAIFEEESTGAREVDPEKCVGCGTCVKACPWGIPTIDTETNVSTKCILCHGYSACVSVCPTGALHFVGWDEAIRKYKEHFRTEVI